MSKYAAQLSRSGAGTRYNEAHLLWQMGLFSLFCLRERVPVTCCMLCKGT